MNYNMILIGGVIQIVLIVIIPAFFVVMVAVNGFSCRARTCADTNIKAVMLGILFAASFLICLL